MNTETSTPIGALQEKLNQRAEKQMIADMAKMDSLYQAFPEYIRLSLRELYVNVGTPERPELARVSQILADNNSTFRKKFLTSYAEKYQEAETSNFISKVDNLQNQIDELHGSLD